MVLWTGCSSITTAFLSHNSNKPFSCRELEKTFPRTRKGLTRSRGMVIEDDMQKLEWVLKNCCVHQNYFLSLGQLGNYEPAYCTHSPVTSMT